MSKRQAASLSVKRPALAVYLLSIIVNLVILNVVFGGFPPIVENNQYHVFHISAALLVVLLCTVIGNQFVLFTAGVQRLLRYAIHTMPVSLVPFSFTPEGTPHHNLFLNHEGHCCPGSETQAVSSNLDHVEQALRENELKYRTLFEGASDSILLMSQDHFIDCNAKALALFGCSLEHIIGAPPYQFSPLTQPDGQPSREKALEKINLALTDGPQSFEWEHCRLDRTPFSAEVHLTRLELGNQVLLQAIVSDITDRKRSEEALRESERKYRELVENANSIILRWTRQGHITFLNEFGQRFFGYKEDEILGRHVVGTIVPETERGGRDLHRLLDAIAADPVAYEQNVNENMRRNGERVWIAWTNKVARDSQGEVAEILSIGADITEYRRTTEALRRREEQFRLIMENLADLVALLDLEGRRLYNSPSYQSILGNPDKLRGSSSFDEIHPEDKELVKRVFDETVRTGIGKRLEYRLIDQDGNTRYVESQGSVIRDMEGHISQVLVVSRDVTNRRLAEEAIHELNATLEQRVAERTSQLEAKNQELKAFAYTVSHDLKAPLRGIAGYAEELDRKHRAGLSERALFCLSQVLTATRNLDQLIEDLLHYSRLDAEIPSPTEIQLRPLIESILQDRNLLLAEQGVEVTLDIPFPTLCSWERGLVQVLTNLIDNAIKYSRGSTPPRIHIQAETLEDTWRLSITDNGVGFDMKYHERIYGLFNRLVRADEFEGTGAGLAIVKKVLDKQGGRISAISAPGQGATFIVELPRRGSSDEHQREI